MFLMIIYWHLLLLYSQGKGSVNVRCDSFPKLNLRLWKDYGVNDCKLRVVDKGACCRSKLFSIVRAPMFSIPCTQFKPRSMMRVGTKS